MRTAVARHAQGPGRRRVARHDSRKSSTTLTRRLARQAWRTAGGTVRHGGLDHRLARGSLSTLSGGSRTSSRKTRRRGSRRRVHRPRHALQQPARRARRDARRGDPAARRAAPRRVLDERQAARLHARHAHQVGVAARRRGAGIPHRAHRRDCSRMLCEHSVLVRDKATPIRTSRADFERGLAEAARHPEVTLLHRLFQAAACASTSSSPRKARHPGCPGLLIGSDVGGALALFGIVRARAGSRHRRAAAHRILFARRSRAAAARPSDRRRRGRARGPELRSSRSWSAENRQPGSRNWSPSCAGSRPARAPEVGAALVACGVPHHRSAAEFPGAVRHHQTTRAGARRAPAWSVPAPCSRPAK